jgi:hypothetical protein
MGIWQGGNAILVALGEHLPDKLIGRRQIEDRLADFIHHRLGHQERHERLAAARMQLDHNILVGPAREPIVQHLCLAGLEIVDAWRLATSQAGTPFWRIQRVTVWRTE